MIMLKMFLMGTFICCACLIFALICLSVKRSLVNWWNHERPLKQQWMKTKEWWNESPGWRLFIRLVIVAVYGSSIGYCLL